MFYKVFALLLCCQVLCAAENDISFYNGDVKLAGTLSKPEGKGPFPAVVLLHGSAPLDRDAHFAGHRLFKVWSDYLVEQGIAVLRYDKRGAGESGGDYAASTIEDFAGDAQAALVFLRQQERVGKVGLVGHSEGGMTALIAGDQADFLVLMAMPFVTWDQLFLVQEEAFQRADGVPEEIIAKIKAIRLKAFQIVREKGSEEKLRAYFNETFDEVRPYIEAYYGPLEGQVQLFHAVWFRYAMGFDPADVVCRLKMPLLAMYGTRDLLISLEQNEERLRRKLKDCAHPDFTIVEVERVNHAFQKCEKGTLAEFFTLKDSTTPETLALMSEWILKRAQ